MKLNFQKHNILTLQECVRQGCGANGSKEGVKKNPAFFTKKRKKKGLIKDKKRQTKKKRKKTSLKKKMQQKMD